jgi:mitochondrial-processing peptidase subunit alpha
VLRGQGPSACIGVFVDSGSVYETKETAGVTHLLEKLAFKGTAHRSHLQVVEELELAGGNVGATAAREQMIYSYDTLKAYMPEAVELLLDCVRNPLFPQDEVNHQVLDAGLNRYSESHTSVIGGDCCVACQLALAREEAQALQTNPERFLMEALNLVGYSGALANPLIAPEDALERINSSAIQKFYHVRQFFLWCISFLHSSSS